MGKVETVPVFEVPGRMVVTWHEGVKAIVDTWQSYFISIQDFHEAVIERGVAYGKERGVRAWIVDSSQAKGAFQTETLEYIDRVIFPTFVAEGVKYFVTITSKTSEVTRMTVSSYSAITAPNGLIHCEVSSFADAVKWLEEQP